MTLHPLSLRVVIEDEPTPAVQHLLRILAGAFGPEKFATRTRTDGRTFHTLTIHSAFDIDRFMAYRARHLSKCRNVSATIRFNYETTVNDLGKLLIEHVGPRRHITKVAQEIASGKTIGPMRYQLKLNVKQGNEFDDACDIEQAEREIRRETPAPESKTRH